LLASVPVHDLYITCGFCSGRPQSGRSAVVDELQRDVEVGLLEHGDDGLQVVAFLAADADLVALICVSTVLGPSSRMSLMIFLAFSPSMPCLMVPVTL
jgi:hypothetical protein